MLIKMTIDRLELVFDDEELVSCTAHQNEQSENWNMEFIDDYGYQLKGKLTDPQGNLVQFDFKLLRHEGYDSPTFYTVAVSPRVGELVSLVITNKDQERPVTVHWRRSKCVCPPGESVLYHVS